MPTLLNINNYHYRRGGADVMFLEQTKLFEQLGWEVPVFSMLHPSNLGSPWSRFFIDEMEFGGSYSLAGKAVRAGRVIYSVQSRDRLRRLLEVVRPDIAHLHNIYHHISPSILPLLRRVGIPTVLTTHDLKLACPSYQMLTHDGICERCKGGMLQNVLLHRCVKNSALISAVVLAESALCKVTGVFVRNVDRFVTPSRFYKDKFIEWGFNPSQFTYVPNHIDPENFQPEFRPGSAFVYFGRLAREKGLSTLIRAASRAKVAVWLIGSGPEERTLRALAEEVDANVEFLGFMTGGALHDRIRAARASVLASEWYENAPVSVLESYALGTPLIGARIGGISELVREGETGFGFESGSIEELAGVLAEVASMPDLSLEAMGRNGRRWVEEEFSAQRYLERILEVYSGVGVRGVN